MTIRLKLLCQASTPAVRAAAFPADEPLDLQGRRKLAAFPRRLLLADRWATSPALRANQTAEALKIDAAVEPLLRDCDYGRWTGRAFDVGPGGGAGSRRGMAARSDGGAARRRVDSSLDGAGRALAGGAAGYGRDDPRRHPRLGHPGGDRSCDRGGSRLVLAHRCRAAVACEAEWRRRPLDAGLGWPGERAMNAERRAGAGRSKVRPDCAFGHTSFSCTGF